MQVREQLLELDMEQQTGSKWEKKYHKAVLSPCLFSLYAEYIMKNAGLEEAQTGIKIARRNINNLRNADDTTLMAESEELKGLLMKMREKSEKVGLKLNIQKNKIMTSGLITSWQIDGETVSDFILGGSKITADGDCSHETWKEIYDQPRQHFKKQRYYFASKGPPSQSYGFPVVIYRCESWMIKEAEH